MLIGVSTSQLVKAVLPKIDDCCECTEYDRTLCEGKQLAIYAL